MRNISYAKTTRQTKEKTKDVTRRLGWNFLKKGELLQAVEKCQGLKKGEKVKKICIQIVTSCRREPLNAITQEDVIREGFPEMTPKEFVEFFCKFNKCEPSKEITRIEVEYLEELSELEVDYKKHHFHITEEDNGSDTSKLFFITVYDQNKNILYEDYYGGFEGETMEKAFRFALKAASIRGLK